MAPHPTQTLHFVSFPEVQQHLTLFLILCWENLFGVIFYHSNEQKVVRLYLLTLKRVNSSEHCISQGAGRLLWGFPCQFPCSNLELGKLWWAWCNVGELWWALYFTGRRWHSLPVLVGELVQPWPRVMRSPESRLTPCLPAHSKLVNQSAPRQSPLYLAFVDLHFQTMPSTQYSHNIHTILHSQTMSSPPYSLHCQLPRMLNLQLPCIARQFLAVVGW